MLATGSRVFLPASEFIVLPHLQQLETKSPLECIEWLIKGADDEVYLAVSADFYDVDDSVDVPAIYAEYRLAYEKYISTFTDVLGAPTLSVDWRDVRYPQWAVGEQVTVWDSHRGLFWLRLDHQDRECPIMIVLTKNVPDDADG